MCPVRSGRGGEDGEEDGEEDEEEDEEDEELLPVQVVGVLDYYQFK